MFWRCWLDIRKNIRPVKKLSDEVLAWLSVWSELRMICTWSSWCHCHPISSCFVKIQIGLTWLTQIVLEKRPLNGCLSVYTHLVHLTNASEAHNITQLIVPSSPADSIWVLMIVRRITGKTRMWADAQRDGRPAKYGWHPLLNAAKLGWCPLLECHAVNLQI